MYWNILRSGALCLIEVLMCQAVTFSFGINSGAICSKALYKARDLADKPTSPKIQVMQFDPGISPCSALLA